MLIRHHELEMGYIMQQAKFKEKTKAGYKVTPKMMPQTKTITQEIKTQGHTCLPTIDMLHVMMPPELLVLTPSGGS